MNDFETDENSIVAPIYLDEFLKRFFLIMPGAYASPRTIARYRRLAECPNVSKTDRDHAELLLTALLYRPGKAITPYGLRLIRRSKEAEITQLFKQVASQMRLDIAGDVKGSDLRQAIFQATGIHLKCNKTLRNYAKTLSARHGVEIYFDKDAIYPPEWVTAFAKVAINEKFAQSAGGRKGAKKRWASAA